MIDEKLRKQKFFEAIGIYLNFGIYCNITNFASPRKVVGVNPQQSVFIVKSDAIGEYGVQYNNDKVYLRHTSTMTKAEKEEFRQFITERGIRVLPGNFTIENEKAICFPFKFISIASDICYWFISRRFDIFHFIEDDIALNAKEYMYKK